MKAMVRILSEWRDLNPRPPAPHAGAIPGYATPRMAKKSPKSPLQS
jgi:hypothetical protein